MSSRVQQPSSVPRLNRKPLQLKKWTLFGLGTATVSSTIPSVSAAAYQPNNASDSSSQTPVLRVDSSTMTPSEPILESHQESMRNHKSDATREISVQVDGIASLESTLPLASSSSSSSSSSQDDTPKVTPIFMAQSLVASEVAVPSAPPLSNSPPSSDHHHNSSPFDPPAPSPPLSPPASDRLSSLASSIRNTFFLKNNQFAAKLLQVNILVIPSNSSAPPSAPLSAPSFSVEMQPSSSSPAPPAQPQQQQPTTAPQSKELISAQCRFGETHFVVTKPLSEWSTDDYAEAKIILRGQTQWAVPPQRRGWLLSSIMMKKGAWFIKETPSLYEKPFAVVMDPLVGSDSRIQRRVLEICREQSCDVIESPSSLVLSGSSNSHEYTEALITQLTQKHYFASSSSSSSYLSIADKIVTSVEKRLITSFIELDKKKAYEQGYAAGKSVGYSLGYQEGKAAGRREEKEKQDRRQSQAGHLPNSEQNSSYSVPSAVSVMYTLSNPPPYFTCPISHRIMRDPVVSPSGFSFDRTSMLRHIEPRTNMFVDPLTRVAIPVDEIIPNVALRDAIQEWINIASNNNRGGPVNP